jgi:CheY-like chemotaxis protein
MIRVLVIDDQPQVRSTISIALATKEKFKVVAVESGAAGLREFEAADFDLVIVDMYMPGMDGPKTIRRLRDHKPNLPVIAISGVLLKSSTRTALDFMPLVPAFADVICLQKPFRPKELFDAVEKAMSYVGGLVATPEPV